MIENDSTIYKLFISNSKTGMEEYNRFIGKLEASHDFCWKNHSIIGENTTEEIRKQIISVDVVIILSGLYSTDEKLIQEEIDIATEYNKPIVIIRPYGMENVPGNIEDIASEIVGWNTPCIVDSIRASSPYEYDE